jgi:hypothetical protein
MPTPTASTRSTDRVAPPRPQEPGKTQRKTSPSLPVVLRDATAASTRAPRGSMTPGVFPGATVRRWTGARVAGTRVVLAPIPRSAAFCASVDLSAAAAVDVSAVSRAGRARSFELEAVQVDVGREGKGRDDGVRSHGGPIGFIASKQHAPRLPKSSELHDRSRTGHVARRASRSLPLHRSFVGFPNHVLDLLHEQPHLERFFDDVLRPELEQSQAIVLTRAPRISDHRNTRGGRVPF